MNNWQGAFRETVTSTAFNLSLSKHMVRALELAYYYDNGLEKGVQFADFGLSVPAMRSLVRRGLVEHHDWYGMANDRPKDHKWYTFTPAGKHVFELCILAGLIKMEVL